MSGIVAMCSRSQNRVNGLSEFATIIILVLLAAATAWAQSSLQAGASIIEGTVHNSAGQPVADAAVSLQEKSQNHPLDTKTDANGKFSFSLHQEGTFTVTAGKSGFRKCVTDPLSLSSGQKKLLDLVLENATPMPSSEGAMEFDDKPNFTVAGVTDWSGAGGHGSDTSLRASEAFARDTLALKSPGSDNSSHSAPASKPASNTLETESKLRAAVAATPDNFEANHQLGAFYLHSGKPSDAIAPLKAAYQINSSNIANAYDLARAYRANGDLTLSRDLVNKLLSATDTNADLHRLKGDLDERSGDPLNAVREYERAATLDPSEMNYFEWGSELLLHRAVAPSVIVFKKGSLAHPDSPRMRLGLGAAFYAAGSYDDASRELCHASDMIPQDVTPYLFLGKMDVTSPAPFPCIAERLARFLKNQPDNPLANYHFAMSIAKKNRESKNASDFAQAQSLLERSVSLDPKLGEAYLQLGILYTEQGNSDMAIAAYTKATEATPSLSEPHYRLSQLYKRNGDKAKADREIQLYKQADKAETEAAERQRREIQQFLVTSKDQPATSAPH